VAADLVSRLFGVRYTLRGVSYLLHRNGFTPQVPAHRAAERDEAAIARCIREVTCRAPGHCEPMLGKTASGFLTLPGPHSRPTACRSLWMRAEGAALRESGDPGAAFFAFIDRLTAEAAPKRDLFDALASAGV
jgi:hypothetical protein